MFGHLRRSSFCACCLLSAGTSSGTDSSRIIDDDLHGLVQREVYAGEALTEGDKQGAGHVGEAQTEGDKRGAIYFLHIPRTGGTSFTWDASRIVWGLRLKSKEGCYSWKDRIEGVGRVAALVRSPRAHVLSQFLYCSEGDIAWMTKVREFPAWVRDWVDLDAKGKVVGDFSAGGHNQIKNQKYVTFTSLPFKCYNPANLQSQHFTCQRPFKYPAKVNLTLALQNVHDAWFVGVAEAYQESLCLLHVKVEGTLPSFCDCKDRARWEAFEQTRLARHAPHTQASHNISEYPAALLAQVDELTRADRQLYAAALRRFVRELRKAEAEFGVRVLCQERLALLARDAGLQELLGEKPGALATA